MGQFGCLFQAGYAGLALWALWGAVHPLLALPLAYGVGMVGAWITVIGLGFLLDRGAPPPDPPGAP
ncbi:MAG: hypothetical protein KC613_19475 [Myxococcales bacterium]|nr:hypothetical protein [Myxococcales bacterium]MCB9525282.1 hypothetical protein [Myxococcales bacterium]